MFDFDIGKLMVVAIVALAVIPPKDLPRVMRTVGQFVGRMRRMAAEFQGQFMDAMREADLDSVRKELEDLKAQAKIQETFDPVGMVRDDVTKAAEQSGIGTSTVSLEGPNPSGFEGPAPSGVAPSAAPEAAAPEQSAETAPSPGPSAETHPPVPQLEREPEPASVKQSAAE